MTLVTLDEADVRMVALIDVSVTQGELRTLTINCQGATSWPIGQRQHARRVCAARA